ncbi:MAG TPA: VOC family protein [Acidimicrobiales bacterium]|nr:VOC family protein [Acidimicrobiales bacterium]
MVQARGIDHVVLNVADVERSVAWYVERLGFEPLRLDEWRRGEVLFASVRLTDTFIIDLFANERSGENVDHLCLVVDPTDLDALAASDEFDVVSGPSEVFGAQGMGRSVYVRDPDGNVVELRNY